MTPYLIAALSLAVKFAAPVMVVPGSTNYGVQVQRKGGFDLSASGQSF